MVVIVVVVIPKLPRKDLRRGRRFFEEHALEGWSRKMRRKKTKNSGWSRLFFTMDARLCISHCAPIISSFSVSLSSMILRLLFLFFSPLLVRSFRLDSSIRFRSLRNHIEVGKPWRMSPDHIDGNSHDLQFQHNLQAAL